MCRHDPKSGFHQLVIEETNVSCHLTFQKNLLSKKQINSSSSVGFQMIRNHHQTTLQQLPSFTTARHELEAVISSAAPSSSAVASSNSVGLKNMANCQLDLVHHNGSKISEAHDCAGADTSYMWFTTFAFFDPLPPPPPPLPASTPCLCQHTWKHCFHYFLLPTSNIRK